MTAHASHPPLRLLALSALLALLLVGCGSSMPAEHRIDVVVTKAGFSPSRIEAQRGELVVITLQNRDDIGHNLTFELPSGRRAISSEAHVDAVMTFPVNTAGSFRFFCAVPGHSEAGELVVSE